VWHSNTQKGDIKNADKIKTKRIYRQNRGTCVKKSIAVWVFNQILLPNRAKNQHVERHEKCSSMRGKTNNS
jgi:hypothetical protein